MKIRYLITGLALGLLGFAGCAEPDDLTRTGSDVDNLVMSATSYPLDALNTQYPGLVDFDAGTATIQVPWYISDTEEIQLDLESMKLSATMPLGAKFEPGLSGVHNLAAGIQRTLVYENGERVPLIINAAYVKSNRSQLTKISLTGAPNALIVITEPATANENGVITIYKTSSSIDGALQSAALAVAPWATYAVTPTAAVNSDGTIDLSVSPVITVTSQDGTKRTSYSTAFDFPALVPSGQIGYKSLLFAFQTLADDAHGFKAGANRSMAVVGNYLIVSDSSPERKLLVFDRYTGELLTTQVNNSGLVGTIHAICNDEAGHLVAVSFAGSTQSNTMFEVYVWNNGITNVPAKPFSEDILGTGPAFSVWRNATGAFSTTGAAWDLGRYIGVKGDMTSGRAMLMSLANTSGGGRLMRMTFQNGAYESIAGTPRGLSSWNNRSKTIPLSTNDECAFLLSSCDGNRRTIYTSEGAGGSSTTIQPSSTWWAPGTGVDGITMGLGYTEFNGVKLVALGNGYVSNSVLAYVRLWVGNVGNFAADTFQNAASKIMDSRLDNYDPAKGPTGPGQGNPTVSGMTNYYKSGSTILGSNGNLTGDVCFGKSEDGNAVQVYLLTTDHGIIAYELTRYDL